jgi:hypothetical protein
VSRPFVQPAAQAAWPLEAANDAVHRAARAALRRRCSGALVLVLDLIAIAAREWRRMR